MKKAYILTISILIILLFSFPVPAKEQKFVVALNIKEIFPFIMGDGPKLRLEKPGVSIEMLHVLGKRLGIEFTFVRLPWKRVLYKLQHGQVDGAISCFSSERQKIGVFPMKKGELDRSRNMSANNYVLYTLKGSKLAWDEKQKKILNLDGVIGAPLGYSIARDLKSWGVKIEESNDPVSNIEKLLLGRIAGLAEHEATIDVIIRKNHEKYKDVQKLEPVLVFKPYYLILSHQFVEKHPQLSEKIWDVLANIRETEMLRIMIKYMN